MKGLDDYIMGVNQYREDSVRHICPKCSAEKYIPMFFDTGGWFYRDEDSPYCEGCNCAMGIVEEGNT